MEIIHEFKYIGRVKLTRESNKRGLEVVCFEPNRYRLSSIVGITDSVLFPFNCVSGLCRIT